MKRIADIVGAPRSAEWRDAQYVGVEIEVEDCAPVRRPPILRAYHWDVTEDGSLRGAGREFISPPTPIDVMLGTLPEVYAAIKGVYGGKSSVRTGIHVHFDMTARTLEEVAAVCTLYSLVEPALYALLPSDRDHGIYCCPWYRAPSEAECLRGMLDGRGYSECRMILSHTAVKYSGLNLRTLAEHGTLEFRQAHTFDTVEGLQHWLTLLDSIVSIALAMGTPLAVMESALTHGIGATAGLTEEADVLAEKYDAWHCAEIIVGGNEHTWVTPALDYSDAPPAEERNIYYARTDVPNTLALFSTDNALEIN